MNFRLIALVSALLACGSAMADGQPDFSPPPMPGFMLKKSDKPLTLEEMKQQADEASKRARAEKEALGKKGK